jgi:predicted O-linked N-acetylglucosamine transferase (SPINDLY family)
MTVGTPTITMPGAHLRTNVATAVYKQMKIQEPPIAQSSKEYIDLAIKIAQDNEKNRSLRKKLKIAANKYLYKNLKVLREFEKFLEAANLAAKKGNKLKDGCVFL